jgi:hypothetical protein
MHYDLMWSYLTSRTDPVQSTQVTSRKESHHHVDPEAAQYDPDVTRQQEARYEKEMDTRACSPSPSHGAPNQSPSLSPVTTPAPTITSSFGASRSSLSLDVRPFLPSGRSKAQRWEDASPEDSSGTRPSSYHEALIS